MFSLFRLSSFSLVFSFALFSLFSYSLFQRVNPWGLEKGFDSYQKEGSVIHTAKPSSIKINSIEVDLPIIPSVVKNGEFETTKKGISYLQDSAVPGQKGNTILYGHNWPNLLGRLPKITPGDVVEIEFADGSTVKYSIEYTAKVTSDQVHILSQTEDARLTIYTCTGLFDTKRFVAVGKLI